MELLVIIGKFNENSFPDIFFITISSKDFKENKNLYVETDLFKTYDKYCLSLDCREAYHEEDILNIKYLKAIYK